MDNTFALPNQIKLENPVRPLNRLIHAMMGGLVFLISFIVYHSTVAPTTSFWDCGEFIASSKILGVIHPPGAPLYLLIGRLMIMLPFFKDIGLRVNMFSVFISAATVFLVYLIIAQLIRRWRGEIKTWEDRLIISVSAAFGALAFAFTDSHWFNAVEAEVYGFSIFFTALVIWLALFWEERSENAGSMLLILFIFYLFGLATGVHLLNILVFPFVLLIAFFHHNKHARYLLMLIVLQVIVPIFIYFMYFQFRIGFTYNPEQAGMQLLEYQADAGKILIIFGYIWISFTLWVIYGLSTLSHAMSSSSVRRPVEFESTLAVFIFAHLVLLLINVLPLKVLRNINIININHVQISLHLILNILFILLIFFCHIYLARYSFVAKLWWWIVFLVFVGYSTYLVIYIRANMHPPINENDPSTLKGMMDYLARKQYGQEDMLLTFLYRKADFIRYQINMMYTRYFGWQFIGQGTTLDYQDRIVEIISYRGLYGLPFIMGLLGVVHHFKRDWKRAVAVLVLFLITGLGIILYLNQPDPQPRERDYSYVGSFLAFSLWIGIGMTALIELIKEKYTLIKKWIDKRATFTDTFTAVFNLYGPYLAVVIFINGILLYFHYHPYSKVDVLITFLYFIGVLLVGALLLFVSLVFIIFSSYVLIRGLQWITSITSEIGMKIAKFSEIVFIVIIGIILVPINLIAFNYHSHDRTDEYVAYDYSYNILQTCEPNAIIFTNGDNDTFPLWFLQEVYGIRKDVRVVNLSLLNTSWYIYQLRDEEPRVPIHMSNREIDHVDYKQWESKEIEIPVPPHIRKRELHKLLYPDSLLSDGLDKIILPEHMKNLPEIGDKVVFTLKPTYPERNPMVLRVQDLMILRILNDNKWERPVYFAVTVANDNMISLDDYLRMDGLAFKIMPYTIHDRVDVNVLRANIMGFRPEGDMGPKYKYTGLNNPDVYFNTNIIKLLGNYRSAFMKLAQTYNMQNEREEAKSVIDSMDTFIPPQVIPYPSELTAMYINNIAQQMGMPVDIEARTKMVIPGRLMSRQERRETANFYAYGYQMYDRAEEILNALIKEDPKDMRLQSELYGIYKQSGQYTKALTFLEGWLQRNPGDPSAQREIEDIRQLMQSDTAMEYFPDFTK